MLVTTKILTERVMLADLAYTMQRMQVIADREGNPFGITTKAFGKATALAAPRLPSSRFNRVVGLTSEETALLPEILDWYADLGSSPTIEQRPGDLNDSLADALAGAAFRQTSFHVSLVGQIADPSPTNVIIRSVATSEAMEQFLDVYLVGWGFPPVIHEGAKSNMRSWFGLPDWRLYLAEIESLPAGAAILFFHENAAYFADVCVHPRFRGKQIQSAFLEHCKSVALQLEADIMCSQAAFASTSHRNIERAGLRTLHTQAEWTRPQV